MNTEVSEYTWCTRDDGSHWRGYDSILMVHNRGHCWINKRGNHDHVREEPPGALPASKSIGSTITVTALTRGAE